MDMLGYEERKAVYNSAIERWGSYAQLWMAVEEMSELINAICKFRRERCDVNDVAEEVADVSIMLEQLCLIFGFSEKVHEIMDEKIRRLERRLDFTEADT